MKESILEGKYRNLLVVTTGDTGNFMKDMITRDIYILINNFMKHNQN